VITAYRPNPPSGPFTVYAQHNSYFHSIGKPICPRQAFLRDLRSSIDKFLQEGDQVILLIDGNSNMKAGDLKNMLSSCTLREVILERHGLNGLSTFRRNNTNNPIDGIWATPNIEISAGGYFDYNEVIMNTDHRCLWIDVSYITAFGHVMPALNRPKARRLHNKDPRVVANYVRVFKSFIKKNNLVNLLDSLRQLKCFPLSSNGIELYEKIDELRCTGVQRAEKKCRKLCMGQVAFSPILHQARCTIKAWSLTEKKKKGLRISSRLWNRALKKVSLSPSIIKMPLEEISHHLQIAYRDYYNKKGDSKELRASALDSLAEALAIEGNSTKEKIIKEIKHREKQRDTARKIKYLRGKINTGSTTMVTVQLPDGALLDLTQKKRYRESNYGEQPTQIPTILPHSIHAIPSKTGIWLQRTILCSAGSTGRCL
jgi:hypothetical protein